MSSTGPMQEFDGVGPPGRRQLARAVAIIGGRRIAGDDAWPRSTSASASSPGAAADLQQLAGAGKWRSTARNTRARIIAISGFAARREHVVVARRDGIESGRARGYSVVHAVNPSRSWRRLWRWRYLAAYVALAASLLAHVAEFYHPDTGFSALILFGDAFESSRLARLREVPIYTIAGDGFDGQFYAQIAVAGNPFDPELATAIEWPALPGPPGWWCLCSLTWRAWAARRGWSMPTRWSTCSPGWCWRCCWRAGGFHHARSTISCAGPVRCSAPG